jgi:hypothetical protein
MKKGDLSLACLLLRRFIKLALVATAFVSTGYRTFAQSPSAADKATYHSEVDDLLSVERVSLLPFTDNLQGIYARPLEAHFTQMVNQMHRWDFVPANKSGMILSPEELEASPEKAIQVSQGMGAEAFFAARITKGPNGVIIHLSLFLSKDGKLLSQAILKDYKQFNINDLKEQMQRLLTEIVSRLPYSGRVLSREANRVTLNLGTKDGVQTNQMLSIIQLIKAHRHPKFNFLVRTEKEIFGKVKVLKVDETLSFGVVVSEKERGAIQKGSKVGPLDFVTYSGKESLSLEPSPEEALENREDSAIAFGKNARAWQPQNPATFGQVGARFGLSSVSESTQLSGFGGLEAKNSFSPGILIEGELWVTPEWTFRARLKQGIVTVDNPRSGSTPTELNQSYSYYEAGVGYRLRFGPYGWSPYAEPYLGFLSHKLFTDDANPDSFLTQQFTGFKIGVNGASPISVGGEYGVGGEFAMVLKPSLKESPATSGRSSEAQIVQFGLFGFKKLGERLKAQLNLDFEMYSATFSGDGTRDNAATSSSQRFTTLSGGLYYMF